MKTLSIQFPFSKGDKIWQR